MKLFSFAGKKKKKERKNVRIDVEDLIEQGMTCEEIAEELDIDKQRVYRIKEAMKRREKTLDKKESSDPDEITSLKIQIEKARLQRELDEAEYRAEIRQQKRDEDLYGPEELEELADDPDQLMKMWFYNQMMRNPTIPNQAVQQPKSADPTDTPSQQENSSEIANLQANVPKLIHAVKAGFLKEEIFVEKARSFQLSDKQAKELYKFIGKKL